MPTKSASNRYGNSRGGRNGHPTEHTNFPWARDFNEQSLQDHFERHGVQVNAPAQTSYAAKAVKFANTIDRINNVSYVRKNGQTVKYNRRTGEFAIIDKNGYVNTYFIPTSGYQYYLNDRRKNQ